MLTTIAIAIALGIALAEVASTYEIVAPRTSDTSGALQECGYPVETDPFTIAAAEILGDELQVRVTYRGGCLAHAFSYCWDGSFRESYPVQAFTAIDHAANDDSCKLEMTELLSFDLSGLKSFFQKLYRRPHGQIEIRLSGGEDLLYAF
ncbi:hypothetical protein [Nannocystis pusilla]|uniref:hypothetical protein n=1 Tax=Nannocystis pusilla TaxID=889268 RepID=UPI003DA33628